MKLTAKLLTPAIFLGLAGVPMGSFGHAQAQTIQWNFDAPGYYNDVGRRAFREGTEAARNDWTAHRDMDPYRYPQYRRPPVPFAEREHYRDAFLRGYDEVVHRERGWDRNPDNYWGNYDHDHDHDHDNYHH